MSRITTQRRETGSRVVICGGRDFDDRSKLANVLDRLHRERAIAQMAVGGSRGVGKLAKEWAEARGIPCEVFHSDWIRLGRAAGRVRNERMLAEAKPDVVVAFPGRERTAHLVQIARDAGIQVVEGDPAPAHARIGFWPLVQWAIRRQRKAPMPTRWLPRLRRKF